MKKGFIAIEAVIISAVFLILSYCTMMWVVVNFSGGNGVTEKIIEKFSSEPQIVVQG
ncbi:MAG: hypothetical protein AB9921_02510 [Erysipelotrichaceae bacterium]